MMHNKNKASSMRRKKLRVSRDIAIEEDNGMIAQSPLALFASQSKDWTPKVPLTYKGHWNCTGVASITNNGITALMTFVDRIERPIIYGGPLLNEYRFEQLHFHWAEDDQAGSEHAIDGVKCAAEAHLVHYNSKYSGFEEASTQRDGLSVTGFLLKVTQVPNKSFEPLTNAVYEISKMNQSSTLSADCLKWMLSINLNEYYTYRGSLTTDPFLESVTWVVYKNPVEISSDQMKSFRQMESQHTGEKILCNARSLQPCPPGLCIYHVNQKTKNNEIPVSFNTRSKL
ncbi:carbonic anhydrase-like [Arctopsyche grandis]|uniref:carbonic anhydrase-like n=1 Tax=Arctopsyche grandis TaxID=121162 RepID=UPI00406D9C18